MTQIQIASQVIIFIGLIMLGVSYFTKHYKSITILCIIASVLLGVSYFLLGAYTAVGLNILGAVAYVFFYVFKKHGKENPLYFIIILWSVTIINGIFTFDGIVSLLPTIASLMFYYSVWQKNNFVYKILGILTALMYMVYNILYSSPVGAISQGVLALISTIGLIIYIIEKIKEKKAHSAQTSNNNSNK